ncbi:hypothetical protein [Caulobacter sp. Root1472]|uniref:hypothetical protein n=1 Tax=Caulobacter sp. Root1472 TaxID=1736470 RepID=UPI0006F7EE29|nr:hypothetical protein [Caulobacter sp. Root1472]KQZ29372.1 hypothetical protein ASD47_19115 [Caulobacter sp. Root1472]
MTDAAPETKGKFERSPTYPFISLRKAEERANQFWEKHRKEAARIAAVAPTWSYGAKSSGLQQTVGALKQYGLLEDFGIGEDRKVQLTELGRRLVADQREGAREAARQEAAMKPRLFKEYAHWINDPPSDNHCLSELELDRGFNQPAAYAFLKAFKETASFAHLRGRESGKASLIDTTDSDPSEIEVSEEPDATPARVVVAAASSQAMPAPTGPTPLSERLKVQVTVGSISVSAVLQTEDEVDTVIRFLQANKVLLSVG